MFGSKPKHTYLHLFEGIIIGGTLAAAAAFVFGTKKGKALQKKVVSQYKKLGRVSTQLRHKFEKIVHLQAVKKIKRAVKSKVKKIVKKVKHRKAA
jgi:gas vesicle protein